MSLTATRTVPVTMQAMSVEEKLRYSRLAAERLIKREIRCPQCGFYLMDVYGREHNITRVKCRKCKFNEVIDTGLFRTMKPRGYRRTERMARRKLLR